MQKKKLLWIVLVSIAAVVVAVSAGVGSLLYGLDKAHNQITGSYLSYGGETLSHKYRIEIKEDKILVYTIDGKKTSTMNYSVVGIGFENGISYTTISSSDGDAEYNIVNKPKGDRQLLKIKNSDDPLSGELLYIMHDGNKFPASSNVNSGLSPEKNN